jgi:ribosomal protein L11 methyltransferase
VPCVIEYSQKVCQMEWIEAKVDFDADTTVAAEELIADVFFSFGVKGVVVDDPSMEVPPGADVLVEDDVRPSVNAVSGYFPAATFDQDQRQRFERALKALTRQLTMRQRIFYRSLDEEDWAESWKAFFWPEKVSARIVVKPTWRDYHPTGDELVLEIDPGMAFGTGTHPTTSLSMQLLEKHLRPDDRLLDVGTGSGILLVAASLLGAAEVHGIDNDPVAVNVAQQNLVLNAMPADRCRAWAGDLVGGVTGHYDVVVANILAPVILGLLPDISGVLAPEGRFICSGILESQQDDVVAKAQTLGFKLIEAVAREEWVALAMTLGAASV